MSHLRRHAGRFGTHTSAEAYQRQITAPVRKWRKVWVAPTGLQPESSYKVCKWIKLDKTEEDADEAFTPAADGDEDEEAELLDGDEGEGEGDADDDLDKEAETPALATPAAGTPAVETSALPTPDSEMPPPPLPSSIPAQPSALSEPPITAESVEETGSAPEPSQAEVVHNNAVEITNTAPGHTEEGLGEAGQAGSIIEMKVPEVENGPAEPAAPLATVDMAAAVDGDVTMEGAEPEAAKSEEALVQDEGLVMGEMEPPQPELAVQGGDHEPLESEAK